MSMTSVGSHDSNDNDSLESDTEFVDWRSGSTAIGEERGDVALSTTSSTRFSTVTERRNRFVAFEDEHEQRLYAGAIDNLDEKSSVSSAAEEDETVESQTALQKKKSKYMRIAKITVLFILWLIFTGVLLVQPEHEHSEANFICITNGTEKIFHVPEESKSNGFFITATGPFIMLSKDQLTNFGNEEYTLTIKLMQITGADDEKHDVSKPWVLYLSDPMDLDKEILVERKKLFALRHMSEEGSKKLLISMVTNIPEPLSLEFYYEPAPINLEIGVIIAIILVVGLYILLTLDIVHRALAIIIFCTLTISMLALLNMRPSLRTIIDWIDFEILLELFGLTLIIAILAETGIIDYITVRIYEISNGHIWPILNTLSLVIFVGSCFLDSILMVLLIAPIAMRICELMQLNPLPLLSCLIIFANVGSVLTPKGQTPSEFVTQNEVLRREGINSLVFIAHMLPGTLIAGASAYLYMRILYHDSNTMRYKDGAEIERLRRVIKVWSRTAKSISPYSKDEQAMRDTVLSKVRRLRRRLKRIGKMPAPPPDYKETVKQLKTQFQITDQALLIKSLFVLFFLIVLIVLHLVPNIHFLSTAWTALLACILLLILADNDDFDGILGRIEWSTMLFLACVIVFSEATAQLGLFDVISNMTGDLIRYSSTSARMFVAILIVLWWSAFLAAFLTDSSVCSLMLRAVIVAVEDIEEGQLPVQPLVWSVLLGTGLGSIGTLIGTYANIICAGLAEKHGYNFPFLYYCKVGFPIMLVCVASVTVYLMVAHVVCHWH
ncbi:P protein-like [Ceratitis capitata]|uniref:P protein-like n=1 Tax=Ceratitis capitata TaxID=7213 RepID=UPI00032991FD|nr:P protein-like [Ceratitis capitata]